MQSIHWLLIALTAGSFPFSLWIGNPAFNTYIRTVGTATLAVPRSGHEVLVWTDRRGTEFLPGEEFS
jgi:hypothetical protein